MKRIGSILILILFLAPASLRAQEETLTRKQVEELASELGEKMQLDFDVNQTYANAGNDIAHSVMLLRLLRTSQARDDENVGKAISVLETLLDSDLVTFHTYPESEKSETFHTHIILFLNRAQKYREEYPRDYPNDIVASAVNTVFAYAQATGQNGKHNKHLEHSSNSASAD